jgi:hypothetical protein
MMKFNPCVPGQCTEEGTHCQGCGRSHEDIAETKVLIKGLVNFAEKKEYENIEEFASFVGKTVLKKLQQSS